MPRIIFQYDDQNTVEIEADSGLSILEVAHQNNIDLEGSCGGSLACSTCHVIVDEKFFDMLPTASDDEEDLLDIAFGVTNYSRLGCQIIVNDSLNGMILKIPNN